MSSAISRAALASINSSAAPSAGYAIPNKSGYGASSSSTSRYEGKSNDTYGKSKVREIAKRNYAARSFDDDGSSDEEEDEGERYSIDPSVELWKAIDFGTKKSQQGAAKGNNAKGKSSNSNTSFESEFDSYVDNHQNNQLYNFQQPKNHSTSAAPAYHTPTKVMATNDPHSSAGSSGGTAGRGPRPRADGLTRTRLLPDDQTDWTMCPQEQQWSNGVVNGTINGGDIGSHAAYAPSSGVPQVRKPNGQAASSSSSSSNNYSDLQPHAALFSSPGVRTSSSAPAPGDATAFTAASDGGYEPSVSGSSHVAFGSRVGKITSSSNGSRVDSAPGGGSSAGKPRGSGPSSSTVDEPWDTWDPDDLIPSEINSAAKKGGRSPAAVGINVMSAGSDAALEETKEASSSSVSPATPVRVASTGKEELKAMMESLLREKEEMARQLERAEAERAAAAEHVQQVRTETSSSQAEATAAAQLERARLHAALEAMEAQNRALAQRVEAQQAETAVAVEKERAERELAVQRMAAQNELLTVQVLEMQATAERDLAMERDALRQAVKRMEAEKSELVQRVQVTEEAAYEKAQLAEKQRRDFADNLRSLEMEKANLARRVEANAAEAALSTAAVAEQLNNERQALCERIGRMEAEKRALAENLMQTEARAEQQASALAAQLQAEKEALMENVERMEREKREMADKLIETERHAQQRAAEISAQLEAEKSTVQAALAAVEEEKRMLAQRLEHNQLAGKEAGAATEALQQEREALQQRLDDMAREKSELTDKLHGTESLAKQREASMAEAIAKEKEELLLTVQRMKAERAEEKRQAEALAANAAKESAAAAAAFAMAATATTEAAHGGVLVPLHMLPMPQSPQMTQNSPLITPKRSLKDILREECQQGVDAGDESLFNGSGSGSKGLSRIPSHLRKEHMVSRAIGVIKEEDDETKANDDNDGRRRKFSKKRSGNSVGGGSVRSAGGGPSSTTKPTATLPAPLPVSVTPGTKGVAASTYATPQQQAAPVPQPQSIVGRSDVDKDLDEASSVNSYTEADLDGSGTHNDSEYEEADAEDEDIDPFESLPAPHAAAARGDLARLKVLEALEPSLLTSFDEAKRSPLFYAVAYGQEEVADYLLAIAPELSLATDAHGDTPMHAATSAGSAGCLERLISAAFGEADPLNAMEMSPAHLARNVECLEVLFRHGADLAALDVNGRSPLFVACAMNREACAEYLIGCLDDTDTDLLITDKRGDTPLHAAACNGAVDCLLMLLQYGIDPRSLNAVGLKAVDLAIRNKQKKCRELLAEYHLHYCTSSDFDSVLFLKTLEGHRSVKKYEMGQIAMKGQLGGGSGNSLHSNGSGGSAGPSLGGSHNRSFTGGGSLSRPRSIFSMKNASVRLQRWGSWLSYEDPQSKKEYWYNSKTGVGQFEKPDKVRDLQIRAVTLGSDQDGYDESQQSATMKLKRKGDWIEYVTEEGKTFFYNEKNGDFSWVAPTFGRAFRAMTQAPAPEIKMPAATLLPAPHHNSEPKQAQTKTKQQQQQPSSSNASTSHAGPSDEIQQHTATADGGSYGHEGVEESYNVDPADVVHNEDWKPYNDPNTGFVFWYNSATNMSQVSEAIERY